MFAFEQSATDLADAARRSRTRHYWFIYGGNDYTGFNFEYVPVPWEAHYTHVWADQHQPNGNVYLTQNPTADLHYHAEAVHRLGDPACFAIPDYIDPSTVDLRWSPDPASPPYIYHFPSQHQSASGVTYTVSGATDVKLTDGFTVQSIEHGNWSIPDNIDPSTVDRTWHPNVLDPALNYHFPVQWNWDNIGGPVRRMPNSTGDKYVNDFVAKTRADMEHWVIPNNINQATFDFSWRPHPKDPPFIYKFPTVWNSEGGPEYHVPGATQEKYTGDLVAETLVDMAPWAVPEEVNVDSVDFSWVPHPKDPPYIYHFGTDWQASVGLTYTVAGATEIKFAGDIPVRGQHKHALEVLDIFFLDKGNDTAQTKYDLLKAQYPNIQKIRYANTIMDTVQRCVTRSQTNKFWVVSSEYDYANFDFAWHAQPWQSYMTHVFPSQHQKWSDTFLINRNEFERHAQWAKGLEEFPNLNFVTDQVVARAENRYNVYYVDHGNDVSQHQFEYLRADVITDAYIIKTRFVDNYLDTFKRIMATAETEYVWIINSVCDYSQFDFTWEPEPWQREMIHVFPSGNQERGDTFYIHVESFKKQMIELELLDWFNVINYCEDQRVERFPVPVHQYYTDDLITEIKNYKFTTPYVVFTNQKDLQIHYVPCLWAKKDRVVDRLSRAGATVAVPRDIKADLVSQIYDYPYIEDTGVMINDYLGGQYELDIVYISNGEPDEEKWYEHLCYQSNYKAKWVRGVNGRTAAYQEAARQSSTPWFFAVFAKLEVLGNQFPWTEWKPDYFQEPKHYIFNSRNPVNGLEYGHQGVIAYNKRLVLENNDPGIDFTLSQPHEVVPILSGIAHYNQSPWMTWRTAFREVVKLKYFMEIQPTLETEHRLNTWLTVAEGDFANWSIRGSTDAVAYYNEVGGDYKKLKLSFEWNWLRERFNLSKP